METRRWSPLWIRTDPRRWKDELPPPLGRRVRVLPVERERQYDTAKSSRKIVLVLALHEVQMPCETLDDRTRQDGWPILLTPPAPDHNLPPLEIDVFHAQLQT